MIPSAQPNAPGGPAQRWWVGLWGLLATALLVRAAWLPAFTRHAWEGHEAEYLAVFQGSWEGAWSTRVVPLLGLLYRGMGALGLPEASLLILALAAGLLSIGALVLLLLRTAGERPALLAGLLVALYGNHAFWSSSAYNVMLPHALLLVGLAALTWRGWGATLLAGLVLGAAAGSRVELSPALLAAPILLGSRSWLQRGAWLAAVLAAWLLCVLPLLEPGAHPVGLLDDAPAALSEGLRRGVFLRPWDAWPALLGAACLAAPGLWRHRRAGALLLCLGLVAWLSSAAFADAGYRQALLPGVCLCGLSALGLDALWRAARRAPVPWGAPLLGLAGGLLAATLYLQFRDTQRIATAYYAPAEPLLAALEAENPSPADDALLARCAELITQPGAGPSAGRFHDPAEGCVLWIEDWQHRRWTSLGVHDRADRVRARYRMSPQGLLRDPSDPGRPPQQLWLLEAHR